MPGCNWWARDARGPRGACRAAGGHAVGGAHVENGAATVENATRTRPYAVNFGGIQRQGMFVRIPRTTATAVPERAGRESQIPSRFARNLEGSERDLFGGRLQDCLVPVLADFCVAPIPFIHQAVDAWPSELALPPRHGMPAHSEQRREDHSCDHGSWRRPRKDERTGQETCTYEEAPVHCGAAGPLVHDSGQ